MNSGISGHRTWECPWILGWFCTRIHWSSTLPEAAMSRASCTVFLRKHLLEMDGGNRLCLDPPFPALPHLFIHTAGVQAGRAAAVPLAQGESHIRRLPKASPPWELSLLLHMQSGGSARWALQGFGSSQHTDVWTFL